MVNPRFVIKAVLSGQRLNINVPLTVAGTVNYIGVEAKCTSEWDDCTVVCYLYQAGTGYTAQLGLIYDAERKLYYYPNAERLTLTAGEWAVWFVGVMAESGQETYKVTSETRYFTVYEYPFASSIPPGDISLDEEAIARATDAQNKANLVLDKYNAGELTGPQGEPGDPAEIGFVQASVDNTTDNPSCAVTVTESPDNTYNMQFAFSGIKGAKGDTGATGPKGDTGATGAPGRDGTDGRDGEDGRTIDDYVLVQAEQPTSETNKMWLKPTASAPVMIPTAEEFETITDDVNGLKNATGYYEINKHVVIDDLTFVVGGISQTGVADGANTARARTSNTLSFYGANTVKISIINNLYEYSLRFYDIKTNAFLRSDSAWSNGDRTLTWNNNECIRVVVRLSTNAVITNTTLLENIVRFDYTLSEIFHDPTPAGFETCGNTEILAAKTLSFTDGTQPVNEYYIVASPLTRIVYKTYDFNSYTPLCVLPFAIIDYYSYGMTNDDNLIAVFTIQSLNDARFVDRRNGTDACRKPAYVFLNSENYQTAHKIDLTTRNIINPTGWLNNSGFYSYNGAFLFCEYTRTIAKTCNIWKVSGDITDPANWNIKLQLTLSGVNTGLKHMHCLVQDPFTNFLYMSTGDDSDGAATYYSTNLGETWALLASGEEKYNRYLNLIFTKQYIYYATDTTRENMHYLYRTIRGTNGVMSFSDIEVLQDLNNRIATYGTVFLPSLNKFFLPERRDIADGNTTDIVMYDIDSDTISTIDTLYSNGNTRIGFRCRYIDYVSRDNIVRCGFGANFPLHNGGYTNYIAMFNNSVPGYPVSQCNNLFLRFAEKHVAIDTNTH